MRGVTSVLWIGAARVAASLILRPGTGREEKTPANPVSEDDRLAPAA
ncbi:hypothetical protein [Streptomyces broussonetiae]|uniref:Uncharacterized protein n=1 Tax=Streptomyces broussonetiae TaxID=2686304 RepID=A0ABV5EHZ4_9ACTN